MIRLKNMSNVIRFGSFLAIHCTWDNWKIGACSAACGPGTRINTRVKLVEESNGGTCTGENKEILECKEKECPGRYFFYR